MLKASHSLPVGGDTVDTSKPLAWQQTINRWIRPYLWVGRSGVKTRRSSESLKELLLLLYFHTSLICWCFKYCWLISCAPSCPRLSTPRCKLRMPRGPLYGEMYKYKITSYYIWYKLRLFKIIAKLNHDVMATLFICKASIAFYLETMWSVLWPNGDGGFHITQVNSFIILSTNCLIKYSEPHTSNCLKWVTLHRCRLESDSSHDFCDFVTWLATCAYLGLAINDLGLIWDLLPPLLLCYHYDHLCTALFSLILQNKLTYQTG